MADNASDRKSVRAKEKASRLALARRRQVVAELMSTRDGREYVWDKLAESGIFSIVGITDPHQLAMFTGFRNAGVSLLNDVMTFCPDSFILAMREHNERDAHSRSDSDDRGPSDAPSDSASLYDDDGTTEGSDASH